MTRNKRILITCISGVIIFVLFFYFLIRPLQAQIKKLNDDHAKVFKLLEISQGYIDRYKSVKEAYLSISAQWEVLSTYLPEEEEMPKLLKEIANAGKSSNVIFLLFKPLGKGDTTDFYEENPVQIRVKCNYHELGSFLSKIAAMKRLVNVTKLTLASAKKKKFPEKFMEADFIATAYTTLLEKPAK